jgi:hypothetical protein
MALRFTAIRMAGECNPQKIRWKQYASAAAVIPIRTTFRWPGSPGNLICPRFTIRIRARPLLEELREYSGLRSDPFERLKILASLKGIKIKPMSIERWRQERRDAVLYPAASGSVILYNPNRSKSRIVFTIE